MIRLHREILVYQDTILTQTELIGHCCLSEIDTCMIRTLRMVDLADTATWLPLTTRWGTEFYDFNDEVQRH